MCAYENCTKNVGLPVRVSTMLNNVGEITENFCSNYHAALWLLNLASKTEGNLNRRVSATALLQAAYEK